MQNDGRDWRRVLSEINPAMARHPAMIHMGALLESHALLEAAYGVYEECVRDDTDSIEALRRLASLAQRWGDVERALAFRRVAHEREIAAQYTDRVAREEVLEYRMAAEGGGASPPKAPLAFVRSHFDEYAGRFDEHLVDSLSYDGHLTLARALTEILGPARGSLDVLDLGCGTGLVGEVIAPHVRTMIGVDVSSEMLEKAREKGVYTKLERADLVDAMASHDSAFDVVTGSDVFTYIGDLGPSMTSVARVLRPGGRGFFTMERDEEGSSYTLASTRRYRHAVPYLVDVAGRAGLDVERCESIAFRRQAETPVPSTLWVVRRPPSQ